MLIITFFVAATALALSLKIFQPGETVAGDASIEQDLKDLEDRIEQLAQAIDAVQEDGTTDPGQLPPADPQGLPPEELFDRNAETRIEKLGDSMAEIRWTMTQRGMMPATEEHILKSRALIFDPQTDIRTKLTGLRVLRTSDQLTDDDVRQMVHVFDQTTDPRAQVGIMRLLDDVRTPEFLDTLMQVSSTSENPRLREEAIDSLSGYLPDPNLKDWLEAVARDDPNSRVKREADRLLKKFWPQGPGG